MLIVGVGVRARHIATHILHLVLSFSSYDNSTIKHTSPLPFVHACFHKIFRALKGGRHFLPLTTAAYVLLLGLTYFLAPPTLRFLAQRALGLEQEAKLMAGVEGWVVGKSAYNTTRYVPPTEATPLGAIP